MNDKKKIIVLIPLEPPYREKLEQAAPSYEFLYLTPGTLEREQAVKAEIFIGNPPPALLKDSPCLKWVQLNSAGTDGYTAPGVLPEGTLLTNATGAYGLGISEHLMAFLLSLYKNFPAYYENQKQALWQDQGPVRSVCGSTVLVVGLGDIGSRFAMLCKAFGAHVIGVRRKGTQKPDYVDRLVLTQDLDTVLGQADVTALSLPGTKETYHLFDAGRIAKMKPGSLLLNVGRGTAIDPAALYEALESGQLGGAAIDVTQPEPLPAHDPLWKAKNLLITPHVSGGYHMPQTKGLIVDIAAENLARFQRGEKLKNLVDFSTGYRQL